MQKNKKVVILTEHLLQECYSAILNEVYYPLSSKVLLIKNYLDRNFKRDYILDMDDNGYPINKGVVNMVSNGVVIQQMQGDEILTLLDDKFHNIIKDKKDRRTFLKQVLSDWFQNKISREGLLTVNKIS